jgi:hypothetical protein
VAWDITPRWIVEIGGQWLAQPGIEQAWVVSATSEVRLRPGARAVPYVRAGLAAFTTTLDSSVANVPAFYSVRMEEARQSLFRPRHTFVDPAIVVGGGLDLQIADNVHLRPAVEVLTAIDGGRTLVAPLATLQVSYRFHSGLEPERRRGKN